MASGDAGASGKRALSWTREPGAWVMLLVAFAAGTAVSGRFVTISVIVFFSLVLLLLAKSPALFMIRGRRWEFLPDMAALVLPAVAGIFYSAWLYPPLGFLYGAGAALVALNYHFGGKGGKFQHVFAEACGMAVMGLVATIASSLSGGILRHLYLGAFFFLFYLASSFRVRYAGSPGFRRIGMIYSALLVAGGIAAAALAHPAGLSFLPLVEDFYSSLKIGKQRPALRRIGLISTAKALVFAVLIVAFA